MTATPQTALPSFADPVPTAIEPWPGLLSAVVDDCLAVLLEGADQDWSRRAGDLDWTCRQTLDHLALGLVGYAGLLIARPHDRYITLFASLDADAPVPACLEGLGIATSLLGTTVRDTAADARAWHPWGHSDATGFAAMGIVELAVHTYDITRTLGLPWTPAAEPSAAVLTRLFPDAPSGHDPSATLLWCTGRVVLPGLPRRTRWQWYGN
ncbi:maleylpyruvate isomerase N-terminal domain-containing protein [Streptosporangium sp. NPDC050855]|uniref:maleylpyruvate isomerase N-terminal domain-containing protein n=1 Tax=Streptosporangium sp. NPDC050855 TaxID=3366194 RepID=UPI0037B1DEBA